MPPISWTKPVPTRLRIPSASYMTREINSPRFQCATGSNSSTVTVTVSGQIFCTWTDETQEMRPAARLKETALIPTQTSEPTDQMARVVIVVRVRPETECWIHYRDRDGSTGQQLLANGQKLELELGGPVKLTVGNAGFFTRNGVTLQLEFSDHLAFLADTQPQKLQPRAQPADPRTFDGYR